MDTNALVKREELERLGYQLEANKYSAFEVQDHENLNEIYLQTSNADISNNCTETCFLLCNECFPESSVESEETIQHLIQVMAKSEELVRPRPQLETEESSCSSIQSLEILNEFYPQLLENHLPKIHLEDCHILKECTTSESNRKSEDEKEGICDTAKVLVRYEHQLETEESSTSEIKHLETSNENYFQISNNNVPNSCTENEFPILIMHIPESNATPEEAKVMDISTLSMSEELVSPRHELETQELSYCEIQNPENLNQIYLQIADNNVLSNCTKNNLPFPIVSIMEPSEEFEKENRNVIHVSDVLVGSNQEVQPEYEEMKSLLCTAEIKTYRCSECDKNFKRAYDLKRHQRIHTTDKPFEYRKSEKSNIKLHYHTDSNEKSYACDQCGKNFKRKYDLALHYSTHSNERPYACVECGKAFSRKFSLTQHYRTHSNERPFACAECGKAFSRKANLTNHYRTHSNERLYTCNECGRTFNRENLLKAHYRIHSNERLYECDECGRTFIRKSNLTKHSCTHLKERLYAYDSYGRALSEAIYPRTQLLTHI